MSMVCVKGPAHWWVAHIFWALLTSSRSLWELLFSSGFFFWRDEKRERSRFLREGLSADFLDSLDKISVFRRSDRWIVLKFSQLVHNIYHYILMVQIVNRRSLSSVIAAGVTCVFWVIFPNFSSLLCWLLCMLLLVGCDILVDWFGCLYPQFA